MNVVIVSCSLNPASRSAALCELARSNLSDLGQSVTLIDLRQSPLPLCDAGACYADPNAAAVKKALIEADAILMGVPIYNYAVSAAAKNVVEMTGRDAWTGKVVGFLCAAGGHGSFMSVMPLANSLMLDFRCIIVPRFVYATKAAVQDGKVVSDEIRRRVAQLCRMTATLAEGVASVDYAQQLRG